MSIKIYDIPPWTQYVSLADQTEFDIPFSFFQSSDIVVYSGDSEVPVDPSEYVVTGAGVTATPSQPSGTVTFNTGRTEGEKITIARDMPIDRTNDLSKSSFRVDSLNLDFDRITSMIQQVEFLYQRTLRISVTGEAEPAENLTVPGAEDRKGGGEGTIFGFDGADGAATLYPSSGIKGEKGDEGPPGDGTLLVSVGDTTRDFLAGKTAGAGLVGLSIADPGVDETLVIDVPEASVQALIDASIPEASPRADVVFSYIDVFSSTLIPFDGNQLWVDGANRTVPGAGVLFDYSAEPLDTVLYCYVFDNAGTLTPEISATAYVREAASGIMVKSDDATRTLVGAIYRLTGQGAIVNSSVYALARSYYNRHGQLRMFKVTPTASHPITTSFSSFSAVEAFMLVWSGEVIEFHYQGAEYVNTIGAVFNSQVWVNGTYDDAGATFNINGDKATIQQHARYAQQIGGSLGSNDAQFKHVEVVGKTSTSGGSMGAGNGAGDGARCIRTVELK